MSQRSKTSMKSYKNSQLPTNGTNSITASAHRAVLEDLIDSAVFIEDGVNTDVRFWFQNEMIESSLSSPFNQTNAGTGSASSTVDTGEDSTEKCYGVRSIETGTTTTGSFSIQYGNPSGKKLGLGHTVTVKWRCALGALSDGTDTYTAYVGLNSSSAAADGTNGAYFRYTHSVNSGKWECITRSAATETATDSGITADTTNHIFSVNVNSDATSVVFAIDGVTVQTHTTNIGVGSSGAYPRPQCGILKSAGTTSRLIYIDWFDFLITRTTAR